MASGLSNEYLVSPASGETQGKVSMPAPSNAQNQLQSIEALLQRIEKANDPAMSAMAKDLVQRLMEFHGAGIERMLEIIHKDATGQDNVIDALGQDPLVRSLLLLYGLHPDGLETRVQQALEKTRPYLKSHGGNVSLMGVDDAGAVTLRLEGKLPRMRFFLCHAQTCCGRSDLRSRAGRYGNHRGRRSRRAITQRCLCAAIGFRR